VEEQNSTNVFKRNFLRDLSSKFSFGCEVEKAKAAKGPLIWLIQRT
jgi:hypothetical protein